MDLLIVDDDELGLRALTRALSSRYSVRTARSTAEAEAAVTARTPDVLLCDYDLGTETSVRFLRAVAVGYPTIWRVLYSGSGEGATDELAPLVNRILHKPVPLATLVAAIESRPK